MFKTTHLAALTIPLAAVLAWPGQAPLMLSVPVILTAIATFGLGAMATARECWTSLVGDMTQKLLLRLRWAVWLRQPADCSVLADAIVERAGLTFDTEDASERANLVGLMFNLRRMNVRHAGAIGSPLTSHELARQLWAVAPDWAQDRDGWLMLAAAAHNQASNVEIPQGPVGHVLRLRNLWIGTLLWRRRRDRLEEIFNRAGAGDKPAIPMDELSPFLLASENDVRGTLVHSAISAALLENDLDPHNDGIGALPLAIQARLVALMLLLEAKPHRGRLRAWLIASGKLPQLMALRDLADQAEDLDLSELDATAFEGPAAAEGLFETFASRAKQAAGVQEPRRIAMPDAYQTGPEADAEEDRGYGWGAKITSLEDVRAARQPAATMKQDRDLEDAAPGLLAAPMAVGQRVLQRVQSSLAVVEPLETMAFDAPGEDMFPMASLEQAPVAAPVAAPVLTPVPGGLAPQGDLAPKPKAPMPKRPVRPRVDGDSAELKTAARAAAEALRRTAPGADIRFAPETAPRAPQPAPQAAPEVIPDVIPQAPAPVAAADGPAPALFLRRVWQPGQTVVSKICQFGGIPNLPAKKEWPRHAVRGEPLHFLARFECSAVHAALQETAPEVLRDMPKKGELLVFADVGSDSARDTDGAAVQVSLMYITPRDLGGATPAPLPADLPDIDHDGGASITLSDRPGQRVFPRLGFDICPILTDGNKRDGHARTQDAIVDHLPTQDGVPQRRLFRRVPDDQREAGGGYWQFDESALGTGFPATAGLARNVFAAIAAHAARARSRMLAHSRLVEDAGLEAQPEEANRMAWLEALAASADILRARLPEQGSAGDTELCASERARMRAWLAAIAHRNPETGLVAEVALRDTLRRLAIEAIQSPERALGLDAACLRFVAPSLIPTVDEADHRIGGAPLPGAKAPRDFEKFLQFDSDPAIGFRFEDASGAGGRLEIYVPRDGKFGARMRRAEGRIVPA